MWEIVSFTGKFSADFLTQVTNKTHVGASQPDVSNVGASQPDVSNAGASQFGVSNSDEHMKLKAQAVNAKGDLRWAMHLARRRTAGQTRFAYSQWKLLDDLDSSSDG